MTTRTPGLRGCLPPKVGAAKFPIDWVDGYRRTGPLPLVKLPVDVSGGITDWRMLGNGPDPTLTVHHGQPVRNCTFAGREHYRMAKAAAGDETETWETTNQLVTEYLAYDHGQDVGANIADLLLAWYRAGKILAFAPVDHTDPAGCDAAMAAFHGLYCGVSLTDNADELFSEHKPWTVSKTVRPDPSEGHCVVRVRSDAKTHTYVTWGALQEATRAWSTDCVGEAWVIITAEDAKAADLDIAALRADIDKLHGQGGGAQADPSPNVEPTPIPGLTLAWLEGCAEHVGAAAVVAFAAAELAAGASGWSLPGLRAAGIAAGGAALGTIETFVANLLVPGTSSLRQARGVIRALRSVNR
jgi:hypothetical protein